MAVLQRDVVRFFPGSKWSGTYTQSDLVQFFGEVANTEQAPKPGFPCTNMGNGYLGSSPGGASVTNISFYGSTTPVSLQLGTIDDATLYDAYVPTANSFRYGGPGNTDATVC